MKLMRKMAILFIFSMLLTFIFTPITAGAQDSISYYSPYPEGTIGISKPEIGWTVLLGDNKVEYVEFILNGLPIDVIYNEDRMSFIANTSCQLNGLNTMQARIKLIGWRNLIIENWTFVVDDSSISEFPHPNIEQLLAVDIANNYRYLLDLPLFEISDSLDYTAQKHAEYQSALNHITHYQKVENAGFFGENVGDRGNYYGFFGNLFEDIAHQSNVTAKEAIESLFDAPYHRIPFLVPANKYYGYGISDNYHVLNFGYLLDGNTKIVAYPGEDQEDVPTNWENFETPDPLRFFEDANNVVGYPIVVGIYGDGVTEIKVKNAGMWDSYDKEVPFYFDSPLDTGGNDEHLSNEVIMIPKMELEISEEYKVWLELEYLENNETKYYNNTWYFTTITPDQKIKFKLGQNYVMVNNEKILIDVVPFIENSRTMVPFRALADSLGAWVDWDSDTKTVIYKKDNLIIELPIGKDSAFVNGEKIQLDQGAIIKSGRSFVPSRFISERLGAEVDWISSKKEVVITVNK